MKLKERFNKHTPSDRGRIKITVTRTLETDQTAVREFFQNLCALPKGLEKMAPDAKAAIYAWAKVFKEIAEDDWEK